MESVFTIKSDTRVRSLEPREIYGNVDGPVFVRIGNGGAGPTGLLGVLAQRFLAEIGLDGRIDWYQDISRYTLEQLRHGVIDVALVYEHDQAQAALAQGYAKDGAIIFYDQFLLAGPRENPACLSPDDTIDATMLKIALRGDAYPDHTLFISRDDQSATNIRERDLWQQIGRQPWNSSTWYHAYPAFPQSALLRAEEAQAYILSDLGTWLSTKAQLKSTKVYVYGGKRLLNPCRALLSPKSPPVVEEFLAFLRGASGQEVIRTHGMAIHGQAYFQPA